MCTLYAHYLAMDKQLQTIERKAMMRTAKASEVKTAWTKANKAYRRYLDAQRKNKRSKAKRK